MGAKEIIESGKAYLGIEFGSTRIKAVVCDEAGEVLAMGGFGWENSLKDGIWTYSEKEIFAGLKACYADMARDVNEKYGTVVKKFAGIGISAMMHGYLAFDKEGSLLVPFRTWRNTVTGEAAEKLTKEFQYNIPQRWSIAHLYQAMLKKEEHIANLDSFTTLAGFVHWKLTGEKVLGVGDASGMFPIDTKTGNYDAGMIDKFDALAKETELTKSLRDLLPKVLSAGENAGTLTKEGALLIDESGNLEAGIPLCPPEGDAGTGMVATNSVKVKTGNISAGTSVFAMVVLEKALSKVYPEIDLVTTPDGALVGMVHCNNCTSEINNWVKIFKEFCDLYDINPDMNDLFTKLYSVSISGEPNCGGVLLYNYLSGEPVTGFEKGALVLARSAEDNFTLANLMRSNLYSAMATLKIGLDLLLKEEGVIVDEVYGHGGYFKTRGVGTRIAAAAVGAPVSVMETASEGGAWGIALLAAYMDQKNGKTLSEYLADVIFKDAKCEKTAPDEEDVKGFEEYLEKYKKGLKIERAAVDVMDAM
ncbi:MAG: ATPase [Lachnospiraceae bacterium]|nr:ATPase [Lachnospiraceae bacterium]